MEEKEQIISILKQVRIALKKKDYVKIKNLSDSIVHTSSTEQNPEVIFIAVIIYSLSKIIEREHYQEYDNWREFYKNYLRSIDKMITALEKDNLNIFSKEVKLLTGSIEKLSGQLKIFISDVFRKAQINKASKMYEHGISMSKTAKILGISIWELAEYGGQTRASDINLSITMDIKERIKLAEDFFK